MRFTGLSGSAARGYHEGMHVTRLVAALTVTSVLAGCAPMPAPHHSALGCDGLLAEASALTADFADSSAARVAAAHAAHAAKMAQYHVCLAEAARQAT
jgi:hypothetical protein